MEFGSRWLEEKGSTQHPEIRLCFGRKPRETETDAAFASPLRETGSGKSQAQQLTFLHSFSGASAQTVSVMPLTLTFPLYIKPTATAFPCRAPDPLSFLCPKAVRVQSTTPRRPWPSVTPCFLSTISSSLKVLSYQYLMAECPL